MFVILRLSMFVVWVVSYLIFGVIGNDLFVFLVFILVLKFLFCELCFIYVIVCLLIVSICKFWLWFDLINCCKIIFVCGFVVLISCIKLLNLFFDFDKNMLLFCEFDNVFIIIGKLICFFIKLMFIGNLINMVFGVGKLYFVKICCVNNLFFIVLIDCELFI